MRRSKGELINPPYDINLIILLANNKGSSINAFLESQVALTIPGMGITPIKGVSNMALKRQFSSPQKLIFPLKYYKSWLCVKDICSKDRRCDSRVGIDRGGRFLITREDARCMIVSRLLSNVTVMGQNGSQGFSNDNTLEPKSQKTMLTQQRQCNRFRNLMMLLSRVHAFSLMRRFNSGKLIYSNFNSCNR